MSLNIEKIKSEIQSIAKILGVSKYDIFGSTKEENSASSKNRKPFSLNSASKTLLIIRVWNIDNQVGVTSTSDLTYDGLHAAINLAFSSASYGSSEINYDFSESSLNEIDNIYLSKEKIFQPNINELVDKIVQAESTILDRSSVFKSVPYNKISNSFSKRFYFNSVGACKFEEYNIFYFYIYVLAQEESKIAREAGVFSIVDNFQNLKIEDNIEKAILKTKNHLNYKSIESGKYKTIFSPEAFLDLLCSFSNFINAQNILDKKSLSNEAMLETQIASSLFNLYDNPMHDKNPIKIHFDEEGTRTQSVEIIKNGILKSFLHSSYTAKKFNTKSTGNAVIGSKLTISHHFFHVVSLTENSCKDKIESLINVVYIESLKSLHAGINPLQGSFSLPFNGFILNKNEKTSIESATVAGDFLSLLKNICFVGDTEEVVSNGISPEIWVNELSITGNAN